MSDQQRRDRKDKGKKSNLSPSSTPGAYHASGSPVKGRKVHKKQQKSRDAADEVADASFATRNHAGSSIGVPMRSKTIVDRVEEVGTSSAPQNAHFSYSHRSDKLDKGKVEVVGALVPGAHDSFSLSSSSTPGAYHASGSPVKGRKVHKKQQKSRDAAVEVADASFPTRYHAGSSIDVPMRSKIIVNRVEEVGTSSASQNAHFSYSHRSDKLNKGKVEVVGALVPGAHDSFSLPSEKHKKKDGVSFFPKVEYVGPAKPPADIASELSGNRKFEPRSERGNTGPRSEASNKKKLSGGRGYPGSPVFDGTDIDEPPPLPNATDSESSAVNRKFLHDLKQRTASSTEPVQSARTSEQMGGKSNSSDQNEMNEAGIAVLEYGVDEYRRSSITSRVKSLRKFCSSHSHIFVGCITIAVLVLIVAITVPLATRSGGVKELTEPPTLSPSSAPTVFPMADGPTRFPTEVPTLIPTTKYTFPPVPAIEFNSRPPDVYTGSWSILGGVINGSASNEQFGTDISMSYDGNVVAASAPAAGMRRGIVRVFRLSEVNDGEKSMQSWTQIGNDIYGESERDRSGESLSLSGDGSVVAIASTGHSGNDRKVDMGQVRVFALRDVEFDGNQTQKIYAWRQLGESINGSAAGDKAGSSLALNADGSWLVVGTPYFDSGSFENVGRAQVFRLDTVSLEWNQIGEDIIGPTSNDLAGTSVAISASGHRVAVGIPCSDFGGGDAGHVQVYDYDKTGARTWVPFGSGVRGLRSYDMVGAAISLSGDGRVLAIGAVGHNYKRGALRIYRNVQRQWEKMGQDLDGDTKNERFGASVSISFFGRHVVFSASSHNKEAGKVDAYVFDESTSLWSRIGDVLTGDEGDNFGYSVSISADGYRIAAGSRHHGNIFGLENGGRVAVFEL